MMVKGFIFFRDGKIPFVIENYRMELFTDDSLLDDFCKEYNFKENYILHGQCFDIGIRGRKATFLVENSIGSTCYLRCYTINMFDKDEEYDSIGLQSPSLDEVFRCEYEYIDMVRAGINLAIEPKVVYKVPFGMNDQKYELEFRIGHDNRLGLLEDLDRKCELILPLHTNEIQECYDITNVLHRLAMFMTSHAEVPFKRITLYKQGLKAGWFYCPLISEDIVGGHGGFFHEFDVMKYIPKILNNIALDSGNKITQSIPLGHLGDFNSMYTPQRFVEQVMAFEYLFDKLDHKNAQNPKFPLKKELECMFNEFPQLLSRTKISAEKISDQIKEIRRTIAHGYAYYYDFKNDSNTKYLMILLDELIKCMSLKWIGFSNDDISNYIDRFVDYFIAKGIGPQFGFFGDAWQTIYQSNKACGAIEHDNIDVIKKSSNFRSSPRIVQLLNDIRPDLPQKSAIDDFEGEVFVITCEDYTGPRRTDRNFKNELPPEELKSRLNKVTEKIKQETPADEELKVLMITHKVLATQQGYEKLLDILNDGLRDKEDPFLLFFMETVEPIYHALNTSDMQLLFDILGIKRYPITKKVEKNKWKELQRQLDEARKKRAIDVFEIINRTKLIPIPPKLDGWYHLYQNTPETIYASNTSIEAFLNLDYAQFIAVKDFLHPEAQYSTEHGVKGEEYDNVIFVISKGWNQYQFETYAPMITKKAVIPSGKQASFERNRNLFYVCCSRPKKRLIFFVTVPIDSTFKSFLVELVGEQNIFTFSQYIERKSIK